MNTDESDAVRRLTEAPLNHGLVKLIQHELGNGLAVLSGYRQLLQRSIQEAFQSTSGACRDQGERWSGYLHIMQAREKRLNDLLLQLRELSPETIDEPLCQNIVRTDIVALCKQIIEQRVPLSPAGILQVSLPAQPLFIRCDPFWIQVLFEHIFFNYKLARQIDKQPAEIRLEPFAEARGRAVKITLRIQSGSPELTPAKEGEFPVQIQELEQDEEEVCLALCHEILHEHAGQVWSEQTGGVALTFPLAE